MHSLFGLVGAVKACSRDMTTVVFPTPPSPTNMATPCLGSHPLGPRNCVGVAQFANALAGTGKFDIRARGHDNVHGRSRLAT
jgi:hypothetical protein